MTLKTPGFLKKYGPVLTREQIPYSSALVFNAGVVKYHDRYVMMFRNDYGFSRQDYDDFYSGLSDNTVPHTNIGLAFSRDGIRWEVFPEPCFEMSGNGIRRAYDPRLTVIEDQCAVCFAVDTDSGIRGGVALTEDFTRFDIKSLSVPENRNMVLFPEKINGKYVRLERPFLCAQPQKFDIWLTSSPDLEHWGGARLLLAHSKVPYANRKIGPGAPPLKTPYGWLTLFHGVFQADAPLASWQRDWRSLYYTGIMLLNLEDPSRIISMAGQPLIAPERDYELDGFRGGVVFPGGMIAEPDGTVKIYYGAADTVECLATAKLDDLIEFCFNCNQKRGKNHAEMEIHTH